MSAARDQLAADLAAVLADKSGPADQAVVAGITLSVVRQPDEWRPTADMEGAQLQREILFLLQDDLGFTPVPWQELVIDGRRWSVEEVVEKGPVLELVMVRYLS